MVNSLPVRLHFANSGDIYFRDTDSCACGGGIFTSLDPNSRLFSALKVLFDERPLPLEEANQVRGEVEEVLEKFNKQLTDAKVVLIPSLTGNWMTGSKLDVREVVPSSA